MAKVAISTGSRPWLGATGGSEVPFFYREGGRLEASALRPDLELPQLIVKVSALRHNLATMQAYCESHGVSIAPHVKTTMTPAIIRRQLAAGAWAVTVATMQQLRVCLGLGVSRVLFANELVSVDATRWLGNTLSSTRTGEVYCLADSRQAVERLSIGWASSGNADPLPVLVELGVPGGRTGCRAPEELFEVARAVVAAPALRLAGVEAFEGILGSTRSAADLARVDRFLEEVGGCAVQLDELGLFDPSKEVVLSAGGSLFFDRVVTQFSRVQLSRPSRVVIRSGCYATHDHGSYGGPPPLSTAEGDGAFRPAVELWCEVLSVPERDRAIAGFGRRDAPFDAGLPKVLARIPSDGGEILPCSDITVTALNDQHAYLQLGGGRVEVGDRLACGVIHPCTAFDKWRQVLLVDDQYRIVETMETDFS